MKPLLKRAQIICAMTLLFLIETKAQAPDTSTVEKLLHYILNPLDKSQVPTSFLEEWGVPIIPMATFNGTLTDSNRINMNLWRTLYLQLRTGYCGSGSNPLPAITTVNTAIKQNMHDTLPVPVPLLIGTYNSVKSYAFSSNLLSHNSGTNQVHDVGGRPENPYQANNLFAACPNIQSTSTGSETFVCKSNLVWNNTGKTIAHTRINFDNTLGFKNITIGTPITVSYADTGTKRWTIKVTFTDSSVLQCYSRYRVLKAAGSNTATKFGDNTPVVPVWGVIDPVTGVHDGAVITVAYSINDISNTLRKPLIVVEGYDVFNVAPNLVDNVDYTIVDFINAINAPFLAGYDFNEKLDDDAGYDLVFINFNNGTDDIIRNAAVIQEAIDRVNNNKALDDRFGNIRQENVVMGISMGGLVARYALADMTKNNIDPETRLLITHDSPHRGANVPLGLQYLIQMAGEVELFGNDIRDIFPEYDEAINLLGEDATQQLLLYRATGPNNFANNAFLNGDYRAMITFAPTDPQPAYRFTATSNGSECGHELFEPYTTLLDADADVFLFYFPLIALKVRTIAESYALPANGSTSKIARLKILSRFKLFGYLPITRDYYDNTAYAPGTHLPVDGAPGGTNPFSAEDFQVPHINAIIPFGGLFGILGYISVHTNGTPTDFTFVPAVSALDASPFNTGSLSTQFVNGVNQAFPSTSEIFIAQETGGGVTNNTHIRFTARNAEWIFNEMENLPNLEHCSTECTNSYYILGNSTICTNETFFVPGLPRGSTITWSSNLGYVSFSSTTANPVTITQTGHGTITLTATIDDACGGDDIVVTKTGIVVGGPYASFSITGYPYSEPSCYETWGIYSFQATLASGQSGTGFQWGYRITGGSGDVMYPYNSPYFTLIPESAGTYEIFVRPTNDCGAGIPESVKTITVSEACSGRIGNFIVSPNPTRGDILVQLMDKERSIKEIEITDKLGNLKKKIKFGADTKKSNISIAELPADIYIIRIYDGKTWVSKKVVKI